MPGVSSECRVPGVFATKEMALIQLRRHMSTDRIESTDKSHPKYKLKHRFTDMELDYLDDADNPLDQADKAKKPFDCKTGYNKWNSSTSGWSKLKKEFCCAALGRGCESGDISGKSTNSSKATSTAATTELTTAATSSSTAKVTPTTAASTSNVTSTSTAASITNATASTSTTMASPSTAASTTTTTPSTSTAAATTSTTAYTTSRSGVAHTIPGCVTQFDERVTSLTLKTAKPGTSCVFGIDDRDEGGHCIMEDGKYGSFGWCWTSKNKDSWGSCSEACPLFGFYKILGKRIDHLKAEVATALNATATANGSLASTEEQTPPLASTEVELANAKKKAAKAESALAFEEAELATALNATATANASLASTEVELANAKKKAAKAESALAFEEDGGEGEGR
eukprot:CAMPEP_0172778350 /NCGR_PEP_ID=MMETSP1074-20121228/201863_1 /TAXON_ID=2916 /ORGANISM="Ceratium fusus, Strain PA161109" /LENGTH=398 /DNA_ID=CAMNT_0013615281 /DNA_START=96 /DNA_END=1291 /DNA_ORIENTATION=-